MHSQSTFASPCGTSSARWPIAKSGFVPMPMKPASARIQLPWSSRNASSVVHCWPSAGTHWRESSQTGQRDGSGTPNCVPHVTQIARLLVAAVVAEAVGTDACDHGLLRALVQPLAAAAHRGEELVEVDLERREDPVRPVLHLETRLACLAPRVVDDLLCLALGELDDLRLRGLAHRLLARLGEEPVGLALRLGEHLLALLDDPARLLDLLGDRRAHLVEDVVDLVAVDPHLVGERHGLRVVHEVVELVDENQDVHKGSVAPVRQATEGSSPATPPGSRAFPGGRSGTARGTASPLPSARARPRCRRTLRSP